VATHTQTHGPRGIIASFRRNITPFAPDTVFSRQSGTIDEPRRKYRLPANGRLPALGAATSAELWHVV
jgi:hypothetical protein